MEIIKEHVEQIPVETGLLEMKYILTRGEGYGIMIQNLTTGETASVQDLTRIRGKAEGVFSRIIAGTVTAVTLKEIAEDYVAEE